MPDTNKDTGPKPDPPWWPRQIQPTHDSKAKIRSPMGNEELERLTGKRRAERAEEVKETTRQGQSMGKKIRQEHKGCEGDLPGAEGGGRGPTGTDGAGRGSPRIDGAGEVHQEQMAEEAVHQEQMAPEEVHQEQKGAEEAHQEQMGPRDIRQD